MAKIRTDIVTLEQVKVVVEKLVETATNERVAPNIRVQAAGLILGHAFEYDYPAPTPIEEG